MIKNLDELQREIMWDITEECCIVNNNVQKNKESSLNYFYNSIYNIVDNTNLYEITKKGIITINNIKIGRITIENKLTTQFVKYIENQVKGYKCIYELNWYKLTKKQWNIIESVIILEELTR